MAETGKEMKTDADQTAPAAADLETTERDDGAPDWNSARLDSEDESLDDPTDVEKSVEEVSFSIFTSLKYSRASGGCWRLVRGALVRRSSRCPLPYVGGLRPSDGTAHSVPRSINLFFITLSHFIEL